MSLCGFSSPRPYPPRATTAIGGNSLRAWAERALRPLPQVAEDASRPAPGLADFQAAGAGAMRELEPVRFHFEEGCESEAAPGRRPARRQRQPRRGTRFDLLQQFLHRRRGCGQSARECKRTPGATRNVEKPGDNLVPPAVVLTRLASVMPANLDPDAALMLRVKQGDGGAFTALVEKYKQPVMNLAYRMLRDATEAEDLAQNVFVQVFKAAPRYEPTAKFSTWLFTIARNLCLNEIRRRSRHPAESLDQTRESGRPAAASVRGQTRRARPEDLLHGELEEKSRCGPGRLAGKPAHRAPALPPGGTELRGNRQGAGLLAVGDQIADPPRARNAQAEAQALSPDRRLGGKEMNATLPQLWFSNGRIVYETGSRLSTLV